MFKRFLKEKRGAAAVEFAIIAFPFFMLLISIMDLGLKSFQQTELDHAMFRFAHTLARESDGLVSKGQYRQDIICGRNAAVTLDCDQLLFGAEAYSNDQSLWGERHKAFVETWNTGCAGSTVIVELRYPVTHFLLPFAIADVVEYQGQDYFRSRGVIRREPLLTGTGTTVGGGVC